MKNNESHHPSNFPDYSLFDGPASPKRPKRPRLAPNTRQLKIQPKLINTSQTFHAHYKEVPLLSLSGEWLRKAGFDCGQRVVVLLEEGQLIIRLA